LLIAIGGLCSYQEDLATVKAANDKGKEDEAVNGFLGDMTELRSQLEKGALTDGTIKGAFLIYDIGTGLKIGATWPACRHCRLLEIDAIRDFLNEQRDEIIAELLAHSRALSYLHKELGGDQGAPAPEKAPEGAGT